MPQNGARKLREDDYTAPSPPRLRVVADSVSRGTTERSHGSIPAHRAPPGDSARPLAEAAYVPMYAENGRRTVTITGHPEPARRRAAVTRSHVRSQPDRIALWAFLLGLFLVFMAVATASASPL